MKTTNAKAKAIQTPAGPAPEKELEKTQAPKTSARRPKRVIHGETTKIQVHGDQSPLAEREVEYAPPKPKDLPYESEDFPNGCLNYDVLKSGNLMRGIHQTYHCDVDENGLTRLEREYEEGYKKSAKETDDKILKMMEEDWTVGDVPETFRHLRNRSEPKSVAPVKKTTAIPTKGPPTIVSRRAASALSFAPKTSIAAPKTSIAAPTTSKAAPKPTMPLIVGRSRPTSVPVRSNASTMRHNAAAAASKSTIGYTKGRNALNALQKREGGLTRSISNLSERSDTTITPARFADQEQEEWRRFDFLRVFDADDEDLEPGLRGALPDCLQVDDDEDEEFVLKLGS
jgi:hypothetical protein